MHTQGCNAYEAMEHLALGKAITLKPFSFQRKAHIEQKRGKRHSNNAGRNPSISEMQPHICKTTAERYVR